MSLQVAVEKAVEKLQAGWSVVRETAAGLMRCAYKESADAAALRRAKEVLGGGEALIAGMLDRLREKNQVQDDQAILTQLGFQGSLPKIPEEVVWRASTLSGIITLRFSSLIDLQQSLNRALGKELQHLGLNFWGAAEDEPFSRSKPRDPEWVVVPMEVEPETLDQSYDELVTAGRLAPDPRDLAHMLAFHHLLTGAVMPGFYQRFSYTDTVVEADSLTTALIIVGVNSCGIIVDADPYGLVQPDSETGLAYLRMQGSDHP